MLQETTQGGTTLVPFIFIPFLVLVVSLLIYKLWKAVKARIDRSEDPFEQAERTEEVTHLLRVSSRKTRLIAALIIMSVAVAGIVVVGRQPVHRTDIEHTDTLGDVIDADIDIIGIRSYLNGTELYLQMTVAGRIVTDTTRYQYEMLVIAKSLDGGDHIITNGSSGHIYALFAYMNGSVAPSLYSPRSHADGSTLTIAVSLSMFSSGSYMIGLEGIAKNGLEQDYTPEDRDSEIPRLLF